MSRHIIASVVSVLLAFAGAAPASAQGHTAARITSASVSQSVGFTLPLNAALPGVGTFTGTLRITGFEAAGNSLFAIGLVTGTLVDGLGNLTSIIKNVSIPVQLPVLRAPVSGVKTAALCSLVNLAVGPFDIGVLGLQIHINQIALDLTADDTTLLGGLLCTVAALLGGGGSVVDIATGLNQVVSVLGT